MAVVIIIAVIAYLAFHADAGHTHHRYQRAHGLSPNIYWSLGRGPYASIRLPGGFRSGTASDPSDAKSRPTVGSWSRSVNLTRFPRVQITGKSTRMNK